MTALEPLPVATVDTARLRRIKPGEIALRFAFGAAISIVVGVVSLAFGPKASGMFLAFPAVLPASVTLIERKEGRREATHNVEGAVFGGLGAIAFAFTAHGLLTRIPAGLALVLAFAAWLVVAIVSYLTFETLRRRIHRRTSPPTERSGAAQIGTKPGSAVLR
jgi:drug/metabolite transporter (DMT)-like permease